MHDQNMGQKTSKLKVKRILKICNETRKISMIFFLMQQTYLILFCADKFRYLRIKIVCIHTNKSVFIFLTNFMCRESDFNIYTFESEH